MIFIMICLGHLIYQLEESEIHTESSNVLLYVGGWDEDSDFQNQDSTVDFLMHKAEYGMTNVPGGVEFYFYLGE